MSVQIQIGFHRLQHRLDPVPQGTGSLGGGSVVGGIAFRQIHRDVFQLHRQGHFLRGEDGKFQIRGRKGFQIEAVVLVHRFSTVSHRHLDPAAHRAHVVHIHARDAGFAPDVTLLHNDIFRIHRKVRQAADLLGAVQAVQIADFTGAGRDGVNLGVCGNPEVAGIGVVIPLQGVGAGAEILHALGKVCKGYLGQGLLLGLKHRFAVEFVVGVHFLAVPVGELGFIAGVAIVYTAIRHPAGGNHLGGIGFFPRTGLGGREGEIGDGSSGIGALASLEEKVRAIVEQVSPWEVVHRLEAGNLRFQIPEHIVQHNINHMG